MTGSSRRNLRPLAGLFPRWCDREGKRGEIEMSNVKAIAPWVLLLLPWIFTPFMGDQQPDVVSVGYIALIGVAVVFGLYCAYQRKNIFLGIFAIATIFCWPIVLYAALLIGGFN